MFLNKVDYNAFNFADGNCVLLAGSTADDTETALARGKEVIKKGIIVVLSGDTPKELYWGIYIAIFFKWHILDKIRL